MGHLIPLGNTLATLLDDYDHELYDIIDDDVLASFERIRNHDLQIENEIQEREIGGSHPVYSNEERKCTKLQVDTLGVDFDQLMGGIMSSDAATIHMFSEYLYEDEEVKYSFSMSLDNLFSLGPSRRRRYGRRGTSAAQGSCTSWKSQGNNEF